MRWLWMVLLCAMLAACGTPADMPSDSAASAALDSTASTLPAATDPPVTAVTSSLPLPTVISAPVGSDRATPPAEATAAPPDRDDPGGQIAYIDGGNLWLLDLSDGLTRQLTSDGQSSDPAWSPDGQTLALTTVRDGLPQLDLVRADGSGRTPLTRGPAQASYAAFGRDGALSFIQRQPGDTPPIAIVRRDASGAETVVHSEPGGLCGPTGLSIAEDGRAALSLSCGRGSYTLISTPGISETLDVGQQIDASVCAGLGVWARSGAQLAVVSAPECAFQQETDIVVVSQPGRTPQVQQLLRSSGIVRLDWSPDGRWLVYDRPDGLWALPSQGGEPRRLSTVGRQPAWRPTGTP